MEKLVYYLDKGNGSYEPFYEYSATNIGIDEIYTRQLCNYFIMHGTEYELVANEMVGREDVLVIKEVGRSHSGEVEQNYRGKGIHIEFRSPNDRENYRLISRIPCNTHFEVMRYLLKDVVDVPGIGQKLVTSREIDEDRGVYVIYVKDLGEEGY